MAALFMILAIACVLAVIGAVLLMPFALVSFIRRNRRARRSQ